MKNRVQILFLFFLVWLALAGCQGEIDNGEPLVESDLPTTMAGVEPSPTSFQPPLPDAEPTPSPTPEPLALTVAGIPVTLDSFNLALQRFHLGIPDAPSEEARQRVLDDYINQILLEQAAYAAGFTLTDSDWQIRYDSLIADAGGEAAFTAWLETNLYPQEVFEQDLRRSFAAAWMRDRLYAEVPSSAEQVRARHVRVSTQDEAEDVLAQLNNGTSFDLMVQVYDPEGLGDLGWFPRGVLFQPMIEEVAFGLSVDEYSGVVKSDVGFHVVQTTDYAANRPLDPDALWAFKLAALDLWLGERQAESEIEIFVP